MPIESLFPHGGGCIKLASSSGCLRVLGIDTVSGPPHGDIAECGARVASRRSPDWLIVGSGCKVPNLAGEVGWECGVDSPS